MAACATPTSCGCTASSSPASPAAALGEPLAMRDMMDAIAEEVAGPVVPGVVRPPAVVSEFMAGGSLKTALARHADAGGAGAGRRQG